MEKLKYMYRYGRHLMMRFILMFRAFEIVLPDRVWTVVLHPDDKVMGGGGLIQRLLLAGKRVEVVIMTGVEKSYGGEKASCGKPYSGVLPPLLIKAGRWRKELFFERE